MYNLSKTQEGEMNIQDEMRINAVQKYNQIMSQYDVQQAYQIATRNRKDNRRNIRLQNYVMVLVGYPEAGNGKLLF